MTDPRVEVVRGQEGEGGPTTKLRTPDSLELPQMMVRGLLFMFYLP